MGIIDPTGLESQYEGYLYIGGNTCNDAYNNYVSQNNNSTDGGSNSSGGGPPTLSYGCQTYNVPPEEGSQVSQLVTRWGLYDEKGRYWGDSNNNGYDLLIALFKNRPLVFLHGFNDNWTLWAEYISIITNNRTFMDLANEYRKSKDPTVKGLILVKAQSLAKSYNIYIFDYAKNNNDSPKNIAPMFVEFLKDNNIFDKTPNIIAHSMGNLVTREAIEFHGLVVHNFAMVSPPNRGSWWATNFTWDKARKYMSYNSAELAELNSPKRLSILQKNVTGAMHIFQAEGDVAVGKNYQIPGLNIPVTLYREGVYPGQVQYSGFSGTHSAICHDGWGVVLSDIMNFLVN